MELKRVQTENAQYREVIGAVEWIEKAHCPGWWECPWCHASNYNMEAPKHKEDCQRQYALACIPIPILSPPSFDSYIYGEGNGSTEHK